MFCRLGKNVNAENPDAIMFEYFQPYTDSKEPDFPLRMSARMTSVRAEITGLAL